MFRGLLLMLAISTVLFAGSTQAQGSNSTNSPSLKVGDYTTSGELTNGSALPLWTLVWRAVGSSFAANSAPLNTSFDQDANSAFLDAPHTMVYTVVNIRNAAANNITRTLDGRQVAQIQDANATYSSIDLLLRATFTRNSVWEDLGVTQESYRQQVLQYLMSYGWNMTAVVPMMIQMTSDAAKILHTMPLPSYVSRQCVLQVSGTNLVPTTLQMQNLITDTLLTMLASDHVFLMRLTAITETSPVNGSGTAIMTFIVQKNAVTPDVSTALLLALGHPDTAGSQAASPFSAAMRNHGINVTASVSSETSVSGDSIQDQIYALTTTHRSSHKHLGAIVGSSVGSAAALIILLITTFVFGHGWLKKRRLQRQAAAWHKEQAELADLENGKTSFHDSGSSLHSRHNPDALPGDDTAAAKCWDIDAADIVICTHADGSEWLLSSSESGQIFRAIRAGVQDVIVKVLGSSTNLASQDLRKEVDVLKSVSYDRNVVQFYGTCPLGDQTMLVLEYMEGGHLRHALTTSTNGELSWHNKGATIALDIVRGLHFLHSHGVMHMSLRATNVFLTKTYSIAKVGDVDQAQLMGSTSRQQQEAAPSSISAYSAPELILNGLCTEKVDMYSFGVILWELITTEVPRRGRLRAITAPQECPAEIERLIDLCLATEPADRPSAKQAFDIISSCSPNQVVAGHSTEPPTRQRSQPTSPMLSLQPIPRVDHTDLSSDRLNMATRSQTLPLRQAPDTGIVDLDCDRPSVVVRSEEDLQTAEGQEQLQAGKLNSSDHAQGILLPSSELQQPALDNGQHVTQSPLHQASAASQSASERLQAIEADNWHNGSGATQTQRQTTDPAQHDSNDVPAADDLQSLHHQQEIDNALQTYWTPSNGEPLDKSEGAAVSGSMNSDGLPLGVQGHLYPSPFAIAADDGSGDLWSWPNAPAAAHTEAAPLSLSQDRGALES